MGLGFSLSKISLVLIRVISWIALITFTIHEITPNETKWSRILAFQISLVLIRVISSIASITFTIHEITLSDTKWVSVFPFSKFL